MQPAKHVRIASFLLIAASFPVAAADAPAAEVAPASAEVVPVAVDPTPTPEVQPATSVAAKASPVVAGPVSVAATVEPEKKEVPWRGSAFHYGHTFAAVSVDKAALPNFDPYYVQAFSIHPEWHFGSLVYAAAQLDLEQELTVSDDTNTINELVMSDVTVDLGTEGFDEPRTGIHLSGSLRLAAPTSKASKAQTKLFSMGPGVTVSRKVALLSGFVASYSARYTQRFHRYTTMQYDAPTVGACGDLRDLSCANSSTTGSPNVHEDLQHGPSVAFSPTEKLHFGASFLVIHAWLYPLTPVSVDAGLGGAKKTLDPSTDVSPRETDAFLLSAAYDVTRELSVSLGASTFSAQLGPDAKRWQPFFNLNTTVSLDVGLDVEALLSRI